MQNRLDKTNELKLLMESGYFTADGAEHLINLGADPNVEDAEGRTPLQFLMRQSCDIDDVMALIRLKANLNVLCPNGFSPLHEMVREMHHSRSIHSAMEECVKTWGAKINILDSNGQTPLQWLMDDVPFHAEEVLCLIGLGADIRVKNTADKSVFDLFREHKVSDKTMGDLIRLAGDKVEPSEKDFKKTSVAHGKEDKEISIIYKKITTENYCPRKSGQLGKQPHMKERLLKHIDTLGLEKKKTLLTSLLQDARENKFFQTKAKEPLNRIFLTKRGKSAVSESSPTFKKIRAMLAKCEKLQQKLQTVVPSTNSSWVPNIFKRAQPKLTDSSVSQMDRLTRSLSNNSL